MTAPKFKQMKQAYGFDDVAIVPGMLPLIPNRPMFHCISAISLLISRFWLQPWTALPMSISLILMSKLGGLAVLQSGRGSDPL